MPSAPPSKISLLAGLGAIQASGPMPAFLVAALGVQISAELGLGPSALGLVLSAYFLTVAAMASIGGSLVQRLGTRAGVTAAVTATLTAVACLALGASTAPALAACLFMAGLGTSVGLPAANHLLVTGLPARRWGLAFGVKMSAVPLATSLSGAAVPLLALTVGWRWAMALGAVFPVTSWLILRAHTSGPSAPLPAARTGGGGMRGMTLIVAAGLVASIAAGAFNSFLVVSAVASGVRPATAGWVAAVAGLSSIAFRVCFGWVADRRTVDGFGFSAVLLSLGALGFAMLALPAPGLLLPAAMLGHIAGWGWGGLFQMAVVDRFQHAPAAATGRMAAGLAFGQGIGPLLFGWQAERMGYTFAWLTVASMALLASAMMAAAYRGRR